jgi:hypothetical protein
MRRTLRPSGNEPAKRQLWVGQLAFPICVAIDASAPQRHRASGYEIRNAIVIWPPDHQAMSAERGRFHMPRLFVRHDVTVYKEWRKAYDDFDSERKTLGVTGHAVFQSADDPNDVTAWHDFATIENAKSFASSSR